MDPVDPMMSGSAWLAAAGASASPRVLEFGAIMQEYQGVMQDTTTLSDRRQVSNDIFVGLNVLAFTGMGALFVSSHLTSWWTAEIFAVLTLAMWALDATWASLIGRYRRLINVRIRYLEALEEALHRTGLFTNVTVSPERSRDPAAVTRGVYTLERQTFYGNKRGLGIGRRERLVIVIFMVAFGLAAAGVGIATYLVTSGVVPKVTL